MTSVELKQRIQGVWTRIRPHLNRRTTLITVTVVVVLSLSAVSVEALIRVHIPSAYSRVPTTLYTRPVPWRPDGDNDNDDDSDAQPIAVGTVDGSPLEWRIPVALAAVPPSVIQAVLAVEDQRFFHHHGLDIKRIGGALVADLRTHSFGQGGSTLTQQLAKNLFLSADRTPVRKLREAAMALVLESRYTKRQILAAYLNEIYLGQDGARAIHGVGAAARYYFGTDIRRVSLAQAAQLAGMISAPNRDDATRHPDAARDRRDMVLELMADQHRISAAAAHRAERDPVASISHQTEDVDARYFRDYVASMLPRTPARGAAVYTTLDPALQRAALRAIARTPIHGAQVALVAIDPRTGDVLAMVGGRQYSASQFNRATEARRQPGSAFKPIVALAALEPRDGKDPAFTLASVLQDEPLSVDTPSGPWQPVDYDDSFRGDVSLRTAMEASLNVPFARVGLAIGPDRVVSMARRVGITSPLRAVPSIALGSSEVSLLELTRAYGVLADQGQLTPTRTVLSETAGGASPLSIHDSTSVSTEVVQPAVAWLVTSMLQGVVRYGTAHALGADPRFQTVAGKTGTSNDWRDAWFVAYTPDIVVGAWVGFDDGTSLKATGAAAALPVVSAFLAQITPDGGWPEFDQPDDIVVANVNTDDNGDCRREYFLDGTEPHGVDCIPVDSSGWAQDYTRDIGDFLRRRAQLVESLLRQLVHRGGQ